MKKTNKFDDVLQNIVDMVGGKGNVQFFIHCVTRLRFNVKDKSVVDVESIGKLKNVLGVQWSGDQLQVIIGPEVADVYDQICEKYNLPKEGAVDEVLDIEEPVQEKKKFSVMKVLEVISACISPLIPMMIGIGMLQAVLMVLSQFGIMDPESSTFLILSSVSDTALYFLPIAMGVTSARKFGASLSIGLLLGGVLVSPTIAPMIMEGTTLFGIHVTATYYCYTIFPMLMTMFICSYVEKYLNKYIPRFLKSVLVPLLTIVIMVPLMLIVIAPIGITLGNWLTGAFIWIYDKIGPLAVALGCCTYPLQVMTGMHFAWDTYVINAYATVGYDGLSAPTEPIVNNSQGAACLAVALKTKDPDVRATSLAAASSAILSGITEPALYGVTFRYKKPLIAVMIGTFFGGLYAGFKHVIKSNYGGSNIFGLGVFLSPDPNSFKHIIIAILISCVITFITTWILVKPEDLKN